MKQDAPSASPLTVALVGALGLASGMGIGRFAFTPMLPLMQRDLGLTLTQGGWLASANYAGYLIGALACFAANPAAGSAARTGLLSVAVLTVGTALTHSFAGWLLLRFLAGMASALVLVGISSWALAGLATSQRGGWSGWVFSGVGLGVMVAGLVGLVAGVARIPPGEAWIAMGCAAGIVAAFAWKPLGAISPIPASAGISPPRAPRTEGWRMVFCYGAFGFGYIIPATFLPAIAREMIGDPAVFGWTWPLFGLSAVVSTVASARAFRAAPPSKVWALHQFVMALGVLAPALFASPWAILFCTLCVGGTFMVVTMAGLQHARIVAGVAAPRLIAAMTAAFAIGQLSGPLTIRTAAGGSASIALPSIVAASLLLLGAAAMFRPAASPVSPLPR